MIYSSVADTSQCCGAPVWRIVRERWELHVCSQCVSRVYPVEVAEPMPKHVEWKRG
jgi:hypothetical protein